MVLLKSDLDNTGAKSFGVLFGFINLTSFELIVSLLNHCPFSGAFIFQILISGDDGCCNGGEGFF